MLLSGMSILLHKTEGRPSLIPNHLDHRDVHDKSQTVEWTHINYEWMSLSTPTLRKFTMPIGAEEFVQIPESDYATAHAHTTLIR